MINVSALARNGGESGGAVTREQDGRLSGRPTSGQDLPLSAPEEVEPGPGASNSKGASEAKGEGHPTNEEPGQGLGAKEGYSTTTTGVLDSPSQMEDYYSAFPGTRASLRESALVSAAVKATPPDEHRDPLRIASSSSTSPRSFAGGFAGGFVAGALVGL